MKRLLCIFFFFMIARVKSQEKEFSFNAQGSVCYFKYTCYAPNNNYTNIKRPFIFIVSKIGQTAQQTFETDTLWQNPMFYNYEFVYLPNEGGSAKEKLQCVNALASLVTYGFSYGRGNLFLQVYDPEITPTDIEVQDIASSFKKVNLNNGLLKDNIVEQFQEDTKAYADEIDAENNKYGTFYEDEPKVDSASILAAAAKKTYFGPPQTFKYTLTGLIKDQATGEALPFTTVMVKGTTIGATTNADGFFTLQKVPTDTSTLIVQYVGYEKTQVFLTPATPKKNFVIQVKPAASSLKAVTVTGYREDVMLVNKSDVSVVKMTPKKLEQLPNIGEKDIMRSFQLMPGVSASNESSSGLYVRGGTPDQNLVLYDGFTVYQVDHLYGFFSAFNSNALKDVQLYKGGFESKFGGRLSSVTEITGKDGNQNKFNIGGDVSLLSVNAFVEAPIKKKFSSIIAFRRSYKGPIYDKLFSKLNSSSSSNNSSGTGRRQMQSTTVSSFFYDLNGKFTYRPTDNDIISLSIFNGTDKLDNSNSFSAPSFGGSSSSSSNFSSSTTDLTKYGNIGSSLKWSKKWNSKFYSNTLISFSNFYSKRDRSQERTTTDTSGETTTSSSGIFENNNLKDWSLKSDYQWDMFEFSQLQFGIFGSYLDVKYTYAQNDTTTILDKKDKAFLGGAYLQTKIKLFNDKLHLLPGIRASYYDATNKMYYEPRLSATYNITKQLTLKGATGKFYQFVNQVTREDILSGNKTFWLLSNGTSVPVSSSSHFIAGLSYETNNYLFSVEGYYKKNTDLTQYSLRINSSPNGTSYNENFFTGYGYSKGIEFLLQRKVGKINGWVSYTLGKSRSHFNAFSDTYYPSDQDVTHEFKVVLLYKYKRFDFSATWIYATGRPYTAPSGAYSITLLDGSTQDFFTVTSKNSLRLPDYHRADLAVTYKLLRGSKGDKKRREIGYIGFSIFNVYNRTNVWYKQYTIESGSIIETNVNYLGITPNLTLSLKLR